MDLLRTGFGRNLFVLQRRIKIFIPTKSTKKRNITDIKGRTKEITCLGCAIQKGEVKILGGMIATSRYFTAHQDYEIPIPGFIILDSKRHLLSIDEFTEAEQRDFIKFLCRLRRGMRKVLKVSTVYLIQEEKNLEHFHLWIFPRYPWMEKRFGRKIQSVQPTMEYARENLKTVSNLKKVGNVTQKLKQFFSITK